MKLLVDPSTLYEPPFILLETRIHVYAAASLFTPVTETTCDMEVPTSFIPDSVEDCDMVGIVYVGKTVGNNILLKSSTRVQVLNIPAVVPIGSPPT